MTENTGPTADHDSGSSNGPEPAGHQRWRADLRGAVQGVGFRPFIYRLARDGQLTGWVRNDHHGVTLEVQGEPAILQRFFERLTQELPPSAQLESFTPQRIPCTKASRFIIHHPDASATAGMASTATMMPDLAPCRLCLAEVFDSRERRWHYPFTNCTQCGPRFTIIESLPYDRERTTMRHFNFCFFCRREYEDPLDRRFHAQPNACPQCGPQLAWWDAHGKRLADRAEALLAAAQALAEGSILALKGVGGFQLLCDATNAATIIRLRERKGRPRKPFALMVRSVEEARELCFVSRVESDLLRSPAAPIALLARRQLTHKLTHQCDTPSLAREVAPGQWRLGLMLPSSPLHALLLQFVDFPLVATSGNRHSEPICTDNDEAVTRLSGIADFYLVHDRPIARPVDDSVAVVWENMPRVWRRARGYAPLPLRRTCPTAPMVAMGGDQNSTFSLGIEDRVVLSQHLGDLNSEPAILTFRQVLLDLLRIHSARPEIIAHDAHPDYQTTRIAEGLSMDFPTARLLAVQHHHAHLAACLAEHGLGPYEEVLGVIWDGTGFGPDGTIWGGEFLVGSQRSFQRVATWRSFPLLGGEQAVRQPCRVTLALLWQILGTEVWRTSVGRIFSPAQQRILERMLMEVPPEGSAGIHSHGVATTSMGRLFDGLAALLDPRQSVHYSGEAAVVVEGLADATERGAYSVEVTSEEDLLGSSSASPPRLDRGGMVREAFQTASPISDFPATPSTPNLAPGPWRLDWRPLFAEAHQDLLRGTAPSLIAARFHNTLVAAILEVARRVALPRVALSGGCFQNQRLTEDSARALRRAGFEVLLHRRIPPNDGGLSFGQLAVAAAIHQGASIK